MLLSSLALADVSSEATLVTGVAQPTDATIKGMTWHCENTKCVGAAWSGVDSFVKRCSTVSAALGPISGFRHGGRSADKSEIATCNRLADKKQAVAKS